MLIPFPVLKGTYSIWNLFESSPDLFNEVKGEWSLSKITSLIHSKGIHLCRFIIKILSIDKRIQG